MTTARKQAARRTSRTSLAAKISLGFLIVLLLHVSIAVIGHIGLDNAGEDLRQYASGHRLMRHSMEIDRLVHDLQSTARHHTHTGHASAEAHFYKTHARLQSIINDPPAEANTSDKRAFGVMRDSIRRYEFNFRRAVEHRTRRAQITETALTAFRDEVRDALDKITGAETSARDASTTDTANRAHRALEASLYHAQQYLTELDSAHIDHAQARIQECREAIAEIPANALGGAQAQKRLLDQIDAYHSSTASLVQATRSYLHLIHVVLAAETAAILRSSGDLRLANEQRVESLYDNIHDDQKGFQRLSLWISILTIVMGILASYVISRSVSSPISEITRTFRRLARGESTPIPGLERNDEIGELANAANVFRQRNLETSRLLDETQRLEQHSRKIIADLEQSNQELDSFAHVASHDMKAPVRAMSSLVKILEEDCGDLLPPEARGHIRALKQRISRMKTLLEDLLLFARSGHDEFDSAELDLFETVRSAFESNCDQARFRLEIEGENVRFTTVRIPLEMILNNLLSNACKHHDREFGTITVHSTVREDSVLVRVSDDGPGIDEKYWPEIFLPFRTLRRRDEIEASGMGLSLVSKLVARFGDSIRVTNNARGRGTTFELEWPVSARAESCTTRTTTPYQQQLQEQR